MRRGARARRASESRLTQGRLTSVDRPRRGPDLTDHASPGKFGWIVSGDPDAISGTGCRKLSGETRRLVHSGTEASWSGSSKRPSCRHLGLGSTHRAHERSPCRPARCGRGADDRHEPPEPRRARGQAGRQSCWPVDGHEERPRGRHLIDGVPLLPSGGGFIRGSLDFVTNGVAHHLDYFIQPEACRALMTWLT